MYSVTKTYPHSLGLSACFRQWRADSHCQYLHGYALAFTLTFEAETLDARNWVQDFGGLKPVKAFLAEMFDHKLLVAKDDPRLDDLTMLNELDLAQILVVNDVGCEAFAKLVFQTTEVLLDLRPGVKLISVECREHEGNAATYYGDKQ